MGPCTKFLIRVVGGGAVAIGFLLATLVIKDPLVKDTAGVAVTALFLIGLWVACDIHARTYHVKE